MLRKLFAQLELWKETRGLTMKEKRMHVELAQKLPRMHLSTVRKYWGNRMSFVCEARLLKPQRLLTLTFEEEKKRVFESWKDWDRKQWEMCFGDLAWLEKHVVDPETFRGNIKHTVLKWSDQIPFWVKVRASKQLYGKWELRGGKSDKNPTAALLGDAGSWGQRLEGGGALQDFFEDGAQEKHACAVCMRSMHAYYACVLCVRSMHA